MTELLSLCFALIFVAPARSALVAPLVGVSGRAWVSPVAGVFSVVGTNPIAMPALPALDAALSPTPIPTPGLTNTLATALPSEAVIGNAVLPETVRPSRETFENLGQMMKGGSTDIPGPALDRSYDGRGMRDGKEGGGVYTSFVPYLEELRRIDQVSAAAELMRDSLPIKSYHGVSDGKTMLAALDVAGRTLRLSEAGRKGPVATFALSPDDSREVLRVRQTKNSLEIKTQSNVLIVGSLHLFTTQTLTLARDGSGVLRSLRLRTETGTMFGAGRVQDVTILF